MNPKVFSGFARQRRNIIWVQKDSISRFQLVKDQFAKPQIVCLITGEDPDSQGFYLEENSTFKLLTTLAISSSFASSDISKDDFTPS